MLTDDELEQWRRYTSKIVYAWLPGKHHDQQDAIQEGLIAAWRAACTFKHSKNNNRNGWIAANIRWRIRDHVLRGYNYSVHGDHSKPWNPPTLSIDKSIEENIDVGAHLAGYTLDEYPVEDEEFINTVRDAIRKLPEQQRKYVFLRFYLCMSPQQMVIELDKKEPSLLWGSKTARMARSRLWEMLEGVRHE